MTHTASAGSCWCRRARTPAMSSRMEREPECSTHSWMALRGASPSAASPRCAISFRTWNEAPSGPTRPNLRMRRSALPWLKPAGLHRHFPSSPAASPSAARAVHLFEVEVPMLFLQGSRDKLADLELLQRLIARLGERASLRLMQDADHSFHVPARTGRRDADVQREMLDTLAAWILSVISCR